MPTKKGRIWFINMMNDNEGKVSTKELTLRSNIPRGLASVFSDEYKLLLSLSLSLSLSLVRNPFSRAFHVQWKMKPDPYMYLRTCRCTLQDLSRIPRSANASVARIEEFLLARKTDFSKFNMPFGCWECLSTGRKYKLAGGSVRRLDNAVDSG